MSAGSCSKLHELPSPASTIVKTARRAVLSTIDRSGDAHAVPVCFALRGDDLVTAIDQKPKSSEREPARVANVRRDARATLLIDRWDEDWTRLGWVMVRAVAALEPPGSASAELLERYPQYRDAAPAGQVISLSPRRILWWLWDADRSVTQA